MQMITTGHLEGCLEHICYKNLLKKDRKMWTAVHKTIPFGGVADLNVVVPLSKNLVAQLGRELMDQEVRQP